jgi:4-hydroxy-tetrahydrodipicolinate synthase
MRQTSLRPGIHVPLITPFAADGRIATESLEQLAHDMLDAGAAGIVALGTTAEAAMLDATEQAAIIALCDRICGERGASLIIGAGSNSTHGSAADIAELAHWPNATAALVSVPGFTRPGEDGVLAHFEHLAAGSPLPLLVYHVPYRTGQPLSAACLRAIGEIPGIAGVKYSAGLDEQAVALLGDLPEGFAVLVGDDIFLSPLLALGATGGIVASAHLATEKFVELDSAWRGGDVARARTLGHSLAPVSVAAFAAPNPTVIKGVLHAQGRIPTADVRLPLLPASQDLVKAAMKKLDRIGA